MHNDIALTDCDAVWMLDDGSLVLSWASYLAQIEDRDTVNALSDLRFDGKIISDEILLNWLEQPDAGLTFLFNRKPIAIQRASLAELAQLCGFIAKPLP
jgi:hypothetical protein